MNKSERAAQARGALDRRFASESLEALRSPPRTGWVKAVRSALGMSQADMARRLDVTPAAVASLERSEREETISLGRLADLARTLDCTLLYAIVPNSTLEVTVQREARLCAAESLGYIGRTMDLEAQGLEPAAAADMFERETRRAIDEHRVWRRR